MEVSLQTRERLSIPFLDMVNGQMKKKRNSREQTKELTIFRMCHFQKTMVEWVTEDRWIACSLHQEPTLKEA